MKWQIRCVCTRVRVGVCDLGSKGCGESPSVEGEVWKEKQQKHSRTAQLHWTLDSCVRLLVLHEYHGRRGSEDSCSVEPEVCLFICLFVYCLMSQQHASVSQGRICLEILYLLPYWDKSCRSNFLPHSVAVYWHQVNQSQCWPYNTRCLAW